MTMGYIVAACFGMVDFSEVREAAWFALPEMLPFGITFDPAACIAIGLLFAVNAIQAIGDFTAATVGGLDRDPTNRELQGGIVAYGMTNMAAALFGGLPTATYSQNVGIVTTNKVVNRLVFALAGAFLLLAGISPQIFGGADDDPSMRAGRRHHHGVFHHRHDRHEAHCLPEAQRAQHHHRGPQRGAGRGDLPGLFVPEPVPREHHHHLWQIAGGHRHPDGHSFESDPSPGKRLMGTEYSTAHADPHGPCCFEDGEVIQLSICWPRKEAMVCASF